MEVTTSDLARLTKERDEFKRLYEMHYEGMGAMAETIKRLEGEKAVLLRQVCDLVRKLLEEEQCGLARERELLSRTHRDTQ
jgi:hypothetical protein